MNSKTSRYRTKAGNRKNDEIVRKKWNDDRWGLRTTILPASPHFHKTFEDILICLFNALLLIWPIIIVIIFFDCVSCVMLINNEEAPVVHTVEETVASYRN